MEFSRKFGRAVSGFSPDAEEALLACPWEGNIRELRNVVERAILSGKGKEVVTADLRLATGGVGRRIPPSAGPSGPPLTPEGIDLPSVQESIEKRYIEEALRLAEGKETKASQLLGVNYHTFRYRRRRLGL